MIGRILLVLLALGATACDTRLRFENQVPGATVRNLRWETAGNTYASPEVLLAGQSSTELSIYPDDAGELGVIHFELEVDGRRVALTVEDPYRVTEDEENTFRITPDTSVRHLLVD